MRSDHEIVPIAAPGLRAAPPPSRLGAGPALASRLGNAAFAATVARDKAAPAKPDAPSKSLDDARIQALSKQVQGVAERAAGQQEAIAGYLNAGNAVVGRGQERARSIFRLFNQAELGFERNLRAANESSEGMQAVVGVMVGMAFGSGIGLVAGGLMEKASALRIGIVTLASEFIGELGEWGYMKAVVPKALPEPPPGVASPHRVESLEKLLGLSRELTALGAKAVEPARVQQAAQRAQAELTAHATGNGTLPAAEVEQRIVALGALEAACQGLQTKLGEGAAEFARLDAETAKALESADIDRIEQNLWIGWLARLDHKGRQRVMQNAVLNDRFRQIGLTGGPESRLRDREGALSVGHNNPGSQAVIEHDLMRQVGKFGSASTDLSPYGSVDIDGKAFGAHSIAGDLDEGTAIRVVGTTKGRGPHDLVLEVDRAG